MDQAVGFDRSGSLVNRRTEPVTVKHVTAAEGSALS